MGGGGIAGMDTAGMKGDIELMGGPPSPPTRENNDPVAVSGHLSLQPLILVQGEGNVSHRAHGGPPSPPTRENPDPVAVFSHLSLQPLILVQGEGNVSPLQPSDRSAIFNILNYQ